jgi:branched-chain amino acid transport system permease protein
MTGITFARYVIIGVILILAIIFMPKGLISLPENVQEWMKRKRPKEPVKETVAE